MINKFFKSIIMFGSLVGGQAGYASPMPWWDMSPQEVRDRINQRAMSIEAPTPSVFSVTNRSIEREGRSTPIRIYTPSEEDNLPVILFIHGGAWVAGSLDTHDNLARYLSSEAKAVVVSVGYLNAPEGKFPLPLEQCYDALTWITEHGPEISADTSKVAVAGDSAGGNLAAALCLMARDRSGPNIDLQVLINPAPDLTCKGTILRQDDSLDMLRWQAAQYLSDPNDANNPYVSPLVAKDLSNLPPAVVILAEQDDLRDDGQRYADRLQAAGISTYIYCQPKTNHLAGHGARASNQARESLDVAITQIRKTFSTNKPSTSTNKPIAELAVRPQTPQEAFSYVEDLYNKLAWFKENGYQVALPTNPQFELLHQNLETSSDINQDALKQVFFNEIYDSSLYDTSLQKLKTSESLIMQGLRKLSLLEKNWGFKLMQKYEAILTLYGPGGDYSAQKGTVRLFTTSSGEFKRATGYEVLLHEIVHIGIEEAIVKKYKLTHWEKERLVDLICLQYLSEVLPSYKMQQKGDKRIDTFVDQNTITNDLPSAIAKFVEQYPRS